MFLKFSGFVGVLISSAVIFLCSLFESAETESKGHSLMQFGRPENTPPVVRIIEPKNNTVHPINSLVRYSISVSDKEDGESRFDEIPSDKIFLEIKFISGTPMDTPNQTPREEAMGLRLIKNSDCFTCHQFKTRLIGPSLFEIANRYAKTADARQILSRRITDGSQAVWGEAIMPAHPDISMEASREIVDWILKNGLNENLNYLPGKEGTFRINGPARAREGFFELKAIYTDKGIPGKPTETLTGEDVVTIRVD
ncbi:MAG: c-type cytochrome [Cyclobacteriaceae bacterium]